VAIWHRLAPDLERKGVLTAWDVDEFAVVCDAVARHRKAAEILDTEGETGENRFGERVVQPWFRVWMDSAATLAKFGGKFGLSPSDRAQLKVGDATKQEDDILTG
jgi:P27 family predicted phage terminase small subunit